MRILGFLTSPQSSAVASRFCLVLLAVATLPFITGCLTNSGPKYGISVYNRMDEPIRDVKVVQNGVVKYKLDYLAPHQYNPLMVADAGILGESVLQYLDPEGNAVTETVKPAADFAVADFRGGMYLEVRPGNDVETFFRPKDRNEISSMPWNFQENFERGIDLPGFSGGR